MSVKISQVCTIISVIVLAILALVPLLHINIPESIWGLAVGSISAIAGNAVAQSVEEFRIRQPKSAKAKITYEAEETE